MFNPESYFFNFQALPLIFTSTLIFATGLFVLVQNTRNPANIFFFLFCLSLNFWLYGRAIMYCSRDAATAFWWAKVFAKLGVVHISPLVYAFSVHWLGLYRQQKKYMIAAFIVAPIFYLIILLTPYGMLGVRRYFWGYYPIYGPVCKIFLIFFFGYFLAAFRNFFSEWRKAQKDPARHKQVKIVTIAYMISFFASADYLPKLMYLPLYPFGYLCVFTWTMVLAYAIVRYRIMDIQTVIHKTIMWFASMTVVTLPFGLFVYIIHHPLLMLDPVSFSFSFIAIAVIFYFYFRNIQPRLDQLFQQRSANLQLVLSRFSSSLVHLQNLRDLLQGFVRTLRRTLYARQISVFLRDEASQTLVPAIAKRVRGLKPILLSHPFVKWMEANDQIVIGSLVQSHPEIQPFLGDVMDYLEKNAAAVVMPLLLADRFMGVVHLGPRENMRGYTSDEISFLSRLKSPVTIAFSNSLHLIAMQQNLQKWNEELEKKVEERTQQLQDTQAQLVQAEKLATIGTLAGGVAHEINNPLTAVLANAQILKMSANPEDMECLSLIEEGAKRCQVIIQKLMKYARKPMGPEISGKVDINKVVENTVTFLNYQLQQENVRLEVEKTTGLPLVEGNSNELEQVITNLILNAKDAIKQAQCDGLIRIQTSLQNHAIEMKVTDNGVGIPKENLSKIFDPFFTTKEIGKGTGLGLAVTYGIVQKHGGKIDVESAPGRGTTFIIRLPSK